MEGRANALLVKIYFIPLLLLILLLIVQQFGASETQDFEDTFSIKEGVSSKTDIFDSFGQPEMLDICLVMSQYGLIMQLK